MVEFISQHQLNIMLVLGCICGVNALFVLVSRFLSTKKKLILALFELSAMVLLLSDRCSRMHTGDTSVYGFWVERISYFLVYSLTIFVLFTINLYLEEIIRLEAGVETPFIRFKSVNALMVLGVFLVILSQFTGYYYYFDEMNVYHVGDHYSTGYLIPMLINLIQISVVLQYYRKMSREIRIAMGLFTFVPSTVSLIQIYAEGLALTNMAIGIVAIAIYLLSLIDLNNIVESENKKRVEKYKGKEESAYRILEEVSSSLAAAFDERDLYTNGHSERVAKYSELIAEAMEKKESECREIYCAALLHDTGKIGIKEDLLFKHEDLTDDEIKELQSHTVLGSGILSKISGAPSLKDGARSHHENYDGSGYPDGLKGDKIPEVARIIAVANYYDRLTSANYFRDALPQSVVREEMVKNSGIMFDPAIADIMIRLIDTDTQYRLQEKGDNITSELEKEITCTSYKSSFTKGIPIVQSVTKISLKCEAKHDSENVFCMPSVILFDSLDGRVHDNKRAIGVYKYIEYGEIWFDGHFISTAARNIKMTAGMSDERPDVIFDDRSVSFEITTSRFKDHLKISLEGEGISYEYVIALPDSSRFSYISLTGENCHISDIEVEEKIRDVKEGDIPRISDEINFIDRIESDIPNVQIDERMSSYSNAAAIKNGTRLTFFTRSLPTADLVWHCPYIVIFSSDDRKIGGENYKEYALIKLNGEATGNDEFAENILSMKRQESFVGWEKWKQLNKDGYECKIYFRKKGNRITTITENLGVYISNVTVIKNMPSEVCFAITGDQCAITDIRVL